METRGTDERRRAEERRRADKRTRREDNGQQEEEIMCPSVLDTSRLAGQPQEKEEG